LFPATFGVFCSLILAAYFTIASASAADRRNIVVILADDLGAGSISAVMGVDLHETPLLDGLAKESVLFRPAYAIGAGLFADAAALMTGKHPARVGITIWAEGSIEGPKNRKLLQGESKHDLPEPAEVTLAERVARRRLCLRRSSASGTSVTAIMRRRRKAST